MNKKILIVTPKFPLPASGACEQDRLEGIKQLKRMGFEIRVISKVYYFADKKPIIEFSSREKIPVNLIIYEASRPKNIWQKINFHLKKIANPFYWDGAAYEYSHKETKILFEKIINNWRPDLVWFDYTYLWPLYKIAKRNKIPIVTRSINFEPSHFLQEDGRTFFNYLKYLPKLASEFITIKKSDLLFSITPHEERIYKKCGAKNVNNLPLRGLPPCLKKSVIIREKEILNVFFMGSTYNVNHNRRALEMIIKEIAPKIDKKFKFFILGNKVPPEFERHFNNNVIYAGPKYGEELEEFLAKMDIALIPSLFGAGMQQKIFEPLARGIPTITSARGLAGYPFRDGEHVLLANSAKDFVNHIADLRDINLRQRLSENALRLSRELFSQNKLDSVVTGNIHNL